MKGHWLFKFSISGSSRSFSNCDDSYLMLSSDTSTCWGDCLVHLCECSGFFFSISVNCIFPDDDQELNKSLIENSAITLGRLAWVCPEIVSLHMEHFMQSWCTALSMYVFAWSQTKTLCIQVFVFVFQPWKISWCLFFGVRKVASSGFWV